MIRRSLTPGVLLRKAKFAYHAITLLICYLLFSVVALGQVDWPKSRPLDEGMDAEILRSMFQHLSADPHKDLKGVVVLRHGKLVAESYFNGDTGETLHDIRSAAKSITSILVGIAIQRHLIGGVNDSIARYLPGLPRDGKQNITIRDLLNMRSGLDADDEDASTPGNEDDLDASSDWIRTVYAVPMKTKPGEKYNYCSINAFIAGAIVENASGMPLDVFAKQTLFDPLGIRNSQWRHVPVNRVTAQGNLYITTRDEARIGELLLHNGKLNGRRILAGAWIKKSVASQVPIAAFDPYADFYGYMWYSKAEPLRNRRILVHFASGNGGNKIYVVPSLDIVVAVTSSAYHHRYGQLRSQDILLRVLSAVQQ